MIVTPAGTTHSYVVLGDEDAKVVCVDAPGAGQARLAPPGWVGLPAAGLHVPVVARFDDQPLLVEAEHRAAREGELLALGRDERRPPLDRAAVALLDGLAEAHVLGPGLRILPARVGDRRLRLAEGRGAEEAVGGVEGGGGIRVVRLPGDLVAVGPALGEAPRLDSNRAGLAG